MYKTTKTELPLSKIDIENSRYFFNQKIIWNPEDPKISILTLSFNKFGIIQPLIVYPDLSSKKFHLLDGFLRAAYATFHNLKEVPVSVLAPETQPEDILDLLLANHYEKICESIVAKIKFIGLGLRLEIKKDLLIKKFLPALNLEPYEKILKDCEHISKLPEDVLQFCEEKNFSLRQCLHLTLCPKDLLSIVFSWRPTISLTASTLEGFLDDLKDYLRATQTSAQTSAQSLSSIPEIQQLLHSTESPQEKTAKLRLVIKKMRYPILSQVNERMEQIRKDICFPKNVSLSWDPCLENRKLSIAINIQSLNDWNQALAHLNISKVPTALNHLLEEL